MFLSSFNCASPMYSFLLIFYEPAKSHKFNLPLKKFPLWSWTSKSNWNIEWERELLAFIEVCLMTLFWTPFKSNSIQSWALLTPNSVSPYTKIPSAFDSWILRALGLSPSWISYTILEADRISFHCKFAKKSRIRSPFCTLQLAQKQLK